MYKRLAGLVILSWLLTSIAADEPPCCPKTIVASDRFPTLVNPNCSHCVDEAKRRGSELTPTDTVLCWIRGYSEGGAIPFRFFLNPYPVISDSYGSFVSDPYAGFARAYGPWYHYRFHGWHGGVMLIKDTKDGTIYSALSGVAREGPKKGTRLKAIPSLVTNWGDWLQQYPQAVAYHLYPKYQPVDVLPIDAEQAAKSRGKTDERLPEAMKVLGVYTGKSAKAYPLSLISEKQLLHDAVDGMNMIILWQAATGTAAAYLPIASPPGKYKAPHPNKDGISPIEPLPKELREERTLTLRHQPDEKNKNAPYVDAETHSRWDVTGRAVSGKLKGWTLQWLDSVQVKWFAWAMEYPETAIYGQSEKPATAAATTPIESSKKLNEQVKAISGTAEFLKSVPKRMAKVVQVDVKKHTITLVVDADVSSRQPSANTNKEVKPTEPEQVFYHTIPGEKIIVVPPSKLTTRLPSPYRRKIDSDGEQTWPLTSDAEIKHHGWWGRLDQFHAGDRVWVWFKTNRQGQPVAISMLMDEKSANDMHGTGDLAVLEPLRQAQRQYLRTRWSHEGIPGTLTFTHLFNGELDVVLDHETMRWARSLKTGTEVQLISPENQPPINGLVKFVQPQRERTLARLVVNGKDQADLKIGDRVHVKMPTPPASIEKSPYPPDIDNQRTKDERIEWFLASIYCTCGVDKDTCTGHVYTLSCCNPNGCGMPNDMRKKLGVLIDQGLTDRAIFDQLLKIHGPLLVKQHLKP